MNFAGWLWSRVTRETNKTNWSPIFRRRRREFAGALRHGREITAEIDGTESAA
jgi:hypothetical protein